VQSFFNVIKVGYQAEQSPGRIGKCLTYISANRNNTDVGGVVYNFKTGAYIQ